MKRYYFDYRGDRVQNEHGEYVLYKEAQAEIDALKKRFAIAERVLEFASDDFTSNLKENSDLKKQLAIAERALLIMSYSEPVKSVYEATEAAKAEIEKEGKA